MMLITVVVRYKIVAIRLDSIDLYALNLVHGSRFQIVSEDLPAQSVHAGRQEISID